MRSFAMKAAVVGLAALWLAGLRDGTRYPRRLRQGRGLR